jgi:hypothetical protein
MEQITAFDVTCCEKYKSLEKGEVLMKRSLRIFALLAVASMLIWIAGCGGDDDEEEDLGPVPVVESTIPAAGATIAGNASVTFTLNKTLAEVTVAGAAGTATIAGKIVTFTPTGDMPAGPVTLTLTGADSGGQEVTHSLSFTAGAVDKDAPALDGGNCDPKDGASGIDPADYPEKIVIAFNEVVSEATVTAKDPDFKSTDEVAADGMSLVLAFLQYSMPNETPFTIKVAVKDAAGNEAELEYSFETMAKEQ